MARRKISGKRRTPAKRTTRRRRRVSGIGMNGDMMAGVGVIAGAVGARVISNIVTKQFPGTSLMLIAAGQVAAGYMLPNFVKNPMARNIGLGMMAIGGTQIVVSTGIISGTGDRMSYRLSGGTSNINRISGGSSNIQAISGRVSGLGEVAPQQSSRYFNKVNLNAVS